MANSAVTPTAFYTTLGRTDGAAVPAGYVGQVIEGTYGPVNQSASNATSNGSSVALTPGNWLIIHTCTMEKNGATISNFYCNLGISANSASLTGTSLADGSQVTFETGSGTANYITMTCQRIVNTSSSATYYGVFQGPTYSAGAPRAYGIIRAVRIA